MPTERDPLIDSKPGDCFRGPVVECKVLHIVIGERGVESVEFIGRSTNPDYPRWSEPCKKSLENWRYFVGSLNVEVIHRAD
jgi:hypothetical protein